jgi:hypothetical protein
MHGRHPRSSHQTTWDQSQGQNIPGDVRGENVPLGVENAMFLEDLGDDGDCRVDRVGDYKDECLGS